MAGKPSKWSADITQVSMEDDDEWNKMAMDRWQTRQHFEHNEIESPEDKEISGDYRQPESAARVCGRSQSAW